MMKKVRASLLLAGILSMVLSTGVFGSRIDYADQDMIQLIQEKLNSAGFDCGTPDGVAGSGTKKAVQDYRAAKGLTEGDMIDAELFNSLTLNNEQSGFVAAAVEALEGSIGEGEKITEVTLYNEDLCVVVDLGDTSGSALPAEDIAISRVSSITDALLELNAFDHLWDTITVDFGGLGEVVNQKEEIQGSGDNRYFDSAKFQLVQNGAATDTDVPPTDASADETSAGDGGITPEVKEFLDSYEAFMDEYCEFMESYDVSDISAMGTYLSLMSKLEGFEEKADAFDEADMTDADYKYYIDVMARIEKRLIDASSNIG